MRGGTTHIDHESKITKENYVDDDLFGLCGVYFGFDVDSDDIDYHY